ncbi:MAG: hypothetical protein ACK559_29000, partial [bacterium]
MMRIHNPDFLHRFSALNPCNYKNAVLPVSSKALSKAEPGRKASHNSPAPKGLHNNKELRGTVAGRYQSTVMYLIHEMEREMG